MGSDESNAVGGISYGTLMPPLVICPARIAKCFDRRGHKIAEFILHDLYISGISKDFFLEVERIQSLHIAVSQNAIG